MKTAIVAMIRDEADDILAWIGWYRSLGASTIVIFDDGSTDGTPDLVEDAAGVFDVRLVRVKPTTDSYYVRQCAAYGEALALLRDEFDWIGFFDGDEYLNLHQDDTLSAFLGRFGTDVGAVAVNWCNYGSSGHVTKPITLTPRAFEYHYAREEAINRHVKSFVRPGAWSGEFANVHYFPLAEGRYVMPDGRDAEWSETRGIIAGEASWEVARVMHYQLRSMEHYVERIRKRPDLQGTVEHFFSADHNHVEDTRPRARLPAITAFMRDVTRRTTRRVLASIRSPLDILVPPPAPSHRLRIFAVQRAEGGILCGEGDTIAARDTVGETQPIFAVRLSDDSTTIGLFRPDRLLQLEHDPNLGAFHIYRVETSEGGTALKHAGTHRYMTAVPVDIGGAVVVDRRTPQGWERFVLSEVTDADAGRAILQSEAFRLLDEALAAPVTLDAMRHLLGASVPVATALLPLLAQRLVAEEAAVLRARLGAVARFVL